MIREGIKELRNGTPVFQRRDRLLHPSGIYVLLIRILIRFGYVFVPCVHGFQPHAVRALVVWWQSFLATVLMWLQMAQTLWLSVKGCPGGWS
jgi:hypothetical protein